MRILVTGSRDWDDVERVRSAMRDLLDAHGAGSLTLVHGDCPTGADRIANDEAVRTGWELIERHPARWRDLGKRAGFVRNAHMVNLGADVCLAFIKDNSLGATHTAELADERGIPVVWHAA